MRTFVTIIVKLIKMLNKEGLRKRREEIFQKIEAKINSEDYRNKSKLFKEIAKEYKYSNEVSIANLYYNEKKKENERRLDKN